MDDLVFSVDINAPIEAVWAELTNRERQPAMFDCALITDLKPGAPLTYVMRDKAHSVVAGKIIDVRPPYYLSYQFLFTTLREGPTTVTWELKPVGRGVRVTVTHTRFTDQVKTHKSVTSSWPPILNALKSTVETGRVPAGTRFKNWVMNTLAFLLPRSTRIAEVKRRIAQL